MEDSKNSPEAVGGAVETFDRVLDDVTSGNPSKQLRRSIAVGLASLAAAAALAAWLGTRPVTLRQDGAVVWQGPFHRLLRDGPARAR